MRLHALVTTVLIAGVFALFNLACGGDTDTPPSTSEPTAAPTSTPVEPNLPAGTLIVVALQPVAFAFTPNGRLFFTERTTGDIRIAQPTADQTPTDPQVQQAIELARADYAQVTGVDVFDVEAVSWTAQEWPDACLGLEEAGEACTETITPGYRIVVSIIDSAGAAVYRTDESSFARLEKIQAGTIGTSDLFASVEVFPGGAECGLLGIAVDPDFETNGYIYVYVTQPIPGDDVLSKPRVIRYTDMNGAGTDPTVIVDDLPTTNPAICGHVGGNLHFGLDGYLYLSLGNNEQTDDAVAADLSSPLGKILRLNKEDGSAAPGNPFEDDPNADPRVFAYGLRNTYDFAFHPTTGEIYGPDNGPGNCDELNLIRAGSDYGVPESLPAGEPESCLGLGGTDPIHLFTRVGRRPEQLSSNMAPAGVAFLEAERYPTLDDGLLVCLFNPDILQLIEFAPPEFDTVERVTDIADCEINVEVWEGTIYYSRADGIYALPPEALAP